MKQKIICLSILLCFVICSGFFSSSKDDIFSLSGLVQKRNLSVNVHTLGELEAAKSTVISSQLGGEHCKITDLIKDGITVQKGELLATIDSGSFADKIEELKVKIKEQKAHIIGYEKSLEQEKHQRETEIGMVKSDLFLAELEYNKTIHHEAPLEEKKLKNAVEKSKTTLESLEAYYADLMELVDQGYSNDFEITQTVNKIKEEKDNLEVAKEQLLCYKDTTFPMQKHKSDTQLKRAQMKIQDVEENTACKIFKAEASLNQAKGHLKDLHRSLANAERELELTKIKAPTDGMVVLKEDYRSGQRRKPRIGDVLYKNQPILDLPDLSSMIVKTKVREIDLHKVQVGKTAKIEVDAFPSLAFTGEITYIGVLALKDPLRTGDEKYFDVHIALQEKDTSLRPGMTARITIHSEEIENAITIPYQALFEDDHQTYCYVLSNNKYKKREIAIGSINDQWVVVESGLNEGEKVSLTLPQETHKL